VSAGPVDEAFNAGEALDMQENLQPYFLWVNIKM
jgi:hypothetical protein